MPRSDRIAVFVVVVLLATIVPAYASGTLRGKVTNGTRGGEPLQGQTVVLYRVVEGEEGPAPRGKTVTDGSGRFEFTGLETASTVVYYPSVVYLDVEYFGPTIRFSQGKEVQTSDVVVFETTEEPSGIRIGMEHLILEPSAGVLLVKELCMVQNVGDRTYIGQKEVAPGKRGTLEFRLPEGYEQLSLGGDLMSCCAVVEENSLFETMAVKPGVRQESYSYQIRYEGKEYLFQKVATREITFMDIFVPDIGIQVEADELEPFGSFHIRNKPYRRFGIKNIQAGALISIRLSNLPPAPKNFNWLALVGVGAVVVVGIWFAVRYGGRPSGDTPPMDPESVIVAMADLDDQFEAGEIGEAEYHRQRDILEKRLLQLEDETEMENRGKG